MSSSNKRKVEPITETQLVSKGKSDLLQLLLDTAEELATFNVGDYEKGASASTQLRANLDLLKKTVLQRMGF